MAIQKLLPSSGHTHNSITSCSFEVPYSEPLKLASLYSGAYIESSDIDDRFVNYLAKSISSPYDTSYVSTYSGHPYPIQASQWVKIKSEFEQCNINVRGLKTRFRYKGTAASSPYCFVEYYLTDTNGTSHSLAYTPGWHTPTYAGNSSTSFVTFLTDSVVVGDSGWVMPVEMVDNFINSGAYLRAVMEFVPYTIPAPPYDFGVPVVTISGPASKVSALEIETSGEIIAKHMQMYLHLPPIPMSGDVGLSISGMVTMTSGLPMHSYCTPTDVSGGIDFYTKRHGYINSIEEVTVSGTQKLYPTAGTYANGSGAKFEMFPSDYLTYRAGTGYNAGATELIVPAYGGDNPMVNYVSEDVDSPNNTSYIGLTNYVASQSGHSNYINIAIGTQMTSLTSVPTSLTTTLRYSGDIDTLDYNIENLVSQYFMTLNGQSYYIGKADYGTTIQYNQSAYSFEKITYPPLYLDGRPQTGYPGNIVATSGALLANLIASGATFSTYTTMSIMTSNGFYNGYKNHAISAFNIEISGGTYTTYIAHPQLMISGAYPTSESGTSLYLSAKSGIDSNFNLYTSGDNQINSGLSFAMPSPSFAIKDLPFYTPGDYLTSLNMYIENGTFRNNSGNFTLTTFNNYTSGELTKNINFHTSNQSGVEDNINMFIGGEGSFSGNTNLPMFIGSFNQGWSGDFPLLIENIFDSGNSSLDFYTVNTVNESGNIYLYINGNGSALSSGSINIYLNQYPNISMSGMDLFTYNDTGSISSKSGINSPGQISFATINTNPYNSDINIYMLGGKYGTDSGDITVFLQGEIPSGYIPLYTHNVADTITKDLPLNLYSSLPSSGDILLHINGGGIDLRQSEISLVTRNAIPKSGSLDFSILGNTSRESMNLSIRVNELGSINSGIPLSVFSALDSGVFNSFTITTKARGYESSLPMYLPTSSTGSDNSSIYMVMLNDTRDNKDVFLYIENNVLDNSANYTLFTQGEGTLNGGSVYSSSMNLFINRGNESVYNTIPMTLAGPSGMFESVPLVMSGGYINESGITLTMPSTSASIISRADLYSHGFLY